MAEVVEAERLKAGGIPRALVAATKRGGIEAAAEAATEHVVVRTGELPAVAETFKGNRCLIGQRNLTHPTALGRLDFDVA